MPAFRVQHAGRRVLQKKSSTAEGSTVCELSTRLESYGNLLDLYVICLV